MHIVEPHKFLSTVIAFYIFFFFSVFVSSKLWNLFKFLTPTGTQRCCQTSIFSPLISHPPNTTFLYYLPCPSNASPSVWKGRPDWCIHKIPLRKIFCFKNPKHQRVFHCHYSPTLLRQQSHVESLQIPKTQSHFLDFYLWFKKFITPNPMHSLACCSFSPPKALNHLVYVWIHVCVLNPRLHFAFLFFFFFHALWRNTITVHVLFIEQ